MTSVGESCGPTERAEERANLVIGAWDGINDEGPTQTLNQALGRQRVDHGRGPSPDGYYLQGVAAVSSDDVWATGDSLMLHWDGTRWMRYNQP